MTGLSGVAAAVQRYAPQPAGYPLAIRLASTGPAVTAWYAELVLPEGASAAAGPATTLERQPVSYRLRPTRAAIPAGGSGVVYVAVGGTQRAPTRVRVHAATTQGSGYAPVDGVFVTGRRGRLVPASEQNWPGSTHIKTTPDGWGGGSGGGFGFGGGGGGGGQVELIIETDDTGRLRRVHHTTDCGGGGGSGGGGGMGGGWQSYAAQGQSEGQHAQQQPNSGGNPLTRLEQTVQGMDARLTRLENR